MSHIESTVLNQVWQSKSDITLTEVIHPILKDVPRLHPFVLTGEDQGRYQLDRITGE